MTRTALITGAGRLGSIGAAIALRLASDGWNLALAYSSDYDERAGLAHGDDDANALAAALAESSARLDAQVVWYPVDLADPVAADGLVTDAGATLGAIDALVLSHCESVDSGLLETTVESFDRHYAVNVRGSWLVLAAFARQLPSSGGSVVALTSDHVVGNVPYGATKGALDRLVLAAAHEFADRELRANVINPGPVDTGWMSDDVRTTLAALHPGGKLGRPEDTANLVHFLLSDEGKWINCQRLYSDGGFAAARLPV